MASFTHCTRTTLIWSQMQIFYMLPYTGGKWTNCFQSCCKRKEKGSSPPCDVIRPSKASYWVYLPIYKFSSSWWGVMVPETIRLGLACTFSICELIRGCGRLSISSFTCYCQNAQLLQQLIAKLLGQRVGELQWNINKGKLRNLMFPSKLTKLSVWNYLQKTENSYEGTFMQKSAYQTLGDKVYKALFPKCKAWQIAV